MNFYKFTNSQSVAKHLQKINYQFDTVEATFVVWQSKFATLKQKFDAWEQIIATMPDTSVAECNCCWDEDVSSFHAFLREYMDIVNKAIDEFYNDTDAAYFYGVLYEVDNCWNDELTPFRYVHNCVEQIKLKKSSPVKAYKITKRRFDNTTYYITLTFSTQGEIIDFVASEMAIGARNSDIIICFENLGRSVIERLKRCDSDTTSKDLTAINNKKGGEV